MKKLYVYADFDWFKEAELNERFGIPEKIRRLSRIDE